MSEETPTAAPPQQEPVSKQELILRKEAAKVAEATAVIGFDSAAGFALTQRVAGMFATSVLVPAQFRGPENLGNCAIAVELASRMNASPLMVMQNLYVVHGRPGWSSKFLLAAVNACGRYTGVRYEWFGTPGKDDWGCRAWSTLKGSGDRVQGPAVSVAMAKAKGWWARKDSNWPSQTELMLTYRAIGYFANTNAPELTMGLPTADEVMDDVPPAAPAKAATASEPEPDASAPPARGSRAKAAAKAAAEGQNSGPGPDEQPEQPDLIGDVPLTPDYSLIPRSWRDAIDKVRPDKDKIGVLLDEARVSDLDPALFDALDHYAARS